MRMKRFSATLTGSICAAVVAAVVFAYPAWTQTARPSLDAVEAHLAAGKNAAGGRADSPDVYGLVTAICVAPLNGAARPDAPAPRENPNRKETYMEPVQAFDDLYWMGTPSTSSWLLTSDDGYILYDTQRVYDAEDVLVDGIKKLGSAPAKVQYLIVSHGHAGEVGGAHLFQSRYGSRIVMNDWDMVDASVNGFPTGKPKRDIVPTDGMKITVGSRNVTLYLTPGHTPGTISSTFQVYDHGKPLTAVYSGGTEFNFPNDVPHFDQYIASVRRLASLAAGANATIVLNNQSQFNGAATKLRMLKDRHPGEAHPLDVGTNAVARYFKIEDECAQAVRLKLLGASGGRAQ